MEKGNDNVIWEKRYESEKESQDIVPDLPSESRHHDDAGATGAG